MSFTYKKYSNPNDTRDSTSFTAIHTKVSKNGKDEARYTGRNVEFRDFIEGIIDNVFSENHTVNSVEITEIGMTIDQAMKEYLKDKYPVISFK